MNAIKKQHNWTQILVDKYVSGQNSTFLYLWYFICLVKHVSSLSKDNPSFKRYVKPFKESQKVVKSILYRVKLSTPGSDNTGSRYLITQIHLSWRND